MAEAAGDAIPWIELFLAAVHTQATDAVARARGVIELRERYRRAAAAMGTPNALALVELVCENPIVTTRSTEDRLSVSRPTALRLLKRMEERGVLSEEAAGARGQWRYVAREMMEAVAGDARGPQHDEVGDHWRPPAPR
jgi:DNA-binding MarR family transcriptional regulator